MRPFLTGSRAYGIPTDKSDWDLVVRLSDEDFLELVQAARAAAPNVDQSSDYVGKSGRSLRVGPLNLLCCLNDAQYECWEEGTAILKDRAPVTREQAIEVFHKLRVEAGLVRPDA